MPTAKFMCPTCNKEFDRKFNFNRHLNKKNSCYPVNRFPFKFTCPRCLKDFDRKYNFDRHMNRKTLCPDVFRILYGV